MPQTKRIIVEIGPDGSPSAFPYPADGVRAAILDRDSIEAEVLRRLAERVLGQTQHVILGDTFDSYGVYADEAAARAAAVALGITEATYTETDLPVNNGNETLGEYVAAHPVLGP